MKTHLSSGSTALRNSQLFLHNLNNMRTSIKCTMEKEQDGTVQFLNIWVKKEGTSLKTTVYRKPTHAGWHLQFKSIHPPQVEKGWYRAWCIGLILFYNKLNNLAELDLLKKYFVSNSYLEKVMSQWSRRNVNTGNKNVVTVEWHALYQCHTLKDCLRNSREMGMLMDQNCLHMCLKKAIRWTGTRQIFYSLWLYVCFRTSPIESTCCIYWITCRF